MRINKNVLCPRMHLDEFYVGVSNDIDIQNFFDITIRIYTLKKRSNAVLLGFFLSRIKMRNEISVITGWVLMKLFWRIIVWNIHYVLQTNTSLRFLTILPIGSSSWFEIRFQAKHFAWEADGLFDFCVCAYNVKNSVVSLVYCAPFIIIIPTNKCRKILSSLSDLFQISTSDFLRSKKLNKYSYKSYFSLNEIYVFEWDMNEIVECSIFEWDFWIGKLR